MDEDHNVHNNSNPCQVRFGLCGWTADRPIPSLQMKSNTPSVGANKSLLYKYCHSPQSPFSCVEVNSSHHKILSPMDVQTWCNETPNQFIFHFKMFPGLYSHREFPVDKLPKSIRAEIPPEKRQITPYRDLSLDSYNNMWQMFHDSLRPCMNAKKMGYIICQFPLGFVFSESNMDFVHMIRERTRPHHLCVEFRDRRWLNEENIKRTLEWIESIEASLIAVDELHHELFGQPRPSNPEVALRRVKPLSIFRNTKYIRVHRREGNQEQRTLPRVVCDEWGRILSNLCRDSSEPFIYFVLGTDAEDAPVITTNEIIARLPSRNVYDWKSIIRGIMNNSGLGHFGFTKIAENTQTIANSTKTTTTTTKDIQTNEISSPVVSGEDDSGFQEDIRYEKGYEDAMNEQRCIALIDLDCFYVEVERRKDPSLKGQPVAVVQYTGIIAISYEARALGVKRGTPLDAAMKICPELKIAKVIEREGKAVLDLYRSASREVMTIIKRFATNIERASIDEVFIDLSKEARKLQEEKQLPNNDMEFHILGNTSITSFKAEIEQQSSEATPSILVSDGDLLLLYGSSIVSKIRQTIRDELGFSCSAGVAHNKFLAKYSCGIHKPNGQTICPTKSVMPHLVNLPIKKIRGYGGKLGKNLESNFGLVNVGDLHRIQESILVQAYGARIGNKLGLLARGICMEKVDSRTLQKSLSAGKEFPGSSMLVKYTQVQEWISRLSMELAWRIEDEFDSTGRYPRTITIHWNRFEGGPTSKSSNIFLAAPLAKQAAISNALSSSGAGPRPESDIVSVISNAAVILFDSFYPEAKVSANEMPGNLKITHLYISLGNMSEVRATGKGSIEHFTKSSVPNPTSSSFSSEQEEENDQAENFEKKAEVFSTWTCSNCSSLVDSRFLRCIECLTPKLGYSLLDLESATSSSIKQPLESSSFSSWTCLNCSNKMDGRFLRCDNCLTPKGSTKSGEALENSNTGGNDNNFSDWICLNCSSNVDGRFLRCNECFATRNNNNNNSKKSNYESPIKKDLAKDVWQCLDCGFLLDGRFLRCTCCGQLKGQRKRQEKEEEEADHEHSKQDMIAPTISAKKKIKTDSTEFWNCSSCSYKNQIISSSSSLLCCEICGETKKEQIVNKNSMIVDLCEDIEDSDVI